MSTINNNKISIIKNYYKKGYSAREIADKLGVSIDAVYYFFRKHKIPRRSYSERNLLNFQKKEPTFKIKKNFSHNSRVLKTAGIMLYWGEGSNWQGEKIVDFANSNPAMIKIFIKFLREICGINEKKLRAFLYCYDNQNIDELIKYWSELTKIPGGQFTKPYIKRNLLCNHKMKYGLLHVRYNDKKLLLLIKKWIVDFTKIY